MSNTQLFHHLVYLDRDFVAGAYEMILGEAPLTQVTKNEGMKAAAMLPLFSAGISAGESRTFSVSTLGMLTKLLPELNRLPDITQPPLCEGAPSQTRWIEGALSVFSTERGNTSITYFAIHGENGTKLVLVTTPEYFSAGLDALIKLSGVVLKEVSIPVRALVRVYAATSSFQEWIATPLVVIERT